VAAGERISPRTGEAAFEFVTNTHEGALEQLTSEMTPKKSAISCKNPRFIAMVGTSPLLASLPIEPTCPQVSYEKYLPF
jgi:hypothetical protein